MKYKDRGVKIFGISIVVDKYFFYEDINIYGIEIIFFVIIRLRKGGIILMNYFICILNFGIMCFLGSGNCWKGS